MSTPALPDFVKTNLDQIEQSLARIAQALIEGNAEFLFGAGMSFSSGVPVGIAVSEQMLRYYFPDSGTNPPSADRLASLASEYPFETIAQAFEHERGTRKALTDVLKQVFWDDRFKATEEHHLLNSISMWDGKIRLRRIFTTNFDRLLEEQSFGARAFRITEENARDGRKAENEGKLCAIYLHGQLDQAYRITEKDIFASAYNIVEAEFKNALFAADAFVFVGYSMNDPDFRRVYMQYRNEITTRGEAGKKTFMVTPPRNEHSYRLGKTIWEERGCVWLPYDALAFFRELRRYLEEKIDRDLRVRVLRKHGLKDDDVDGFEDLVRRAQETLLVARNDAIQFLDEASPRVGVR